MVLWGEEQRRRDPTVFCRAALDSAATCVSRGAWGAGGEDLPRGSADRVRPPV